ncbi:hypothetical protein [Bradyrhizobium sp. USDA 3364]
MPRQNSSGGKKRLGRITKMGRPHHPPPPRHWRHVHDPLVARQAELRSKLVRTHYCA